jgi:hypothetical protein
MKTSCSWKTNRRFQLCHYWKRFESFHNHIFTFIIFNIITTVLQSDKSLKQNKRIINYIILGILTIVFRFETILKQEKTMIKYIISRIPTLVFQYEMSLKQDKRIIRLFESFVSFYLHFS